jgi:hypothetical protein
MASMSKHLNEENVLDILNESDEHLISDSSDDNTDCEDDIVVADPAGDEENSEVQEEGQCHSLGDADYNSGFIWEDTDNYHGHELFSGHSGSQNSAIHVQGIVSVFIIYQ